MYFYRLPRNDKVFRFFLGLIIGIFSIQIPLYAIVVCIGEDGHISLEYAINGKCANPLQATTQKAQTVFYEYTSSTEHCGGCLDVSLPKLNTIHPYNGLFKLLSHSDLFPSLRFNIVELVNVQTPLSEKPTHSIISYQSITQFLKTVVLLI